MSDARERTLSALRRLRALAQSGLYYSKDAFDEQRFEELARLGVELVAAWFERTPSEVEALLPTRRVPGTPIIDVRGAILSDERILLVRESDGRWSLPGGWAEVNESPSASVEREVLEESGIRCRATRVLAVWDRQQHDHPASAVHCYKLVFACQRLDDGAFRPNSETTDADFFALGKLPELSTRRITKKQIEAIFELASSDAPTVFD